MEDSSSSYKSIVQSLTDKAPAKIEVVKRAEEAFEVMRNLLRKIETELLKTMASVDNRIVIKYSERGPFDLEFKICDDILIFTLHSYFLKIT